MVIKVETYGEDVLKKLYSDLYDKEDWAEECELCLMPTLLHRDTDGKRLGSCTRKPGTSDEVMNSWSLFKKKMKPVRDWYRDDMDKKRTHNDIMEVLKTNQEAMKSMTEGTMEGLKSMAEAIMNGNRGTTNKLVKPAKVPSWCKVSGLLVYIS